jgi:hypothetical protein
MEINNMRLAALILGIIGGLLGLFYGFSVPGWNPVIGRFLPSPILVTLLLGIAGLVGGALSMAKPKAGGIILLTSGLGTIVIKSFSSAFLTGLPPGILMLAGGILALVAKYRK